MRFFLLTLIIALATIVMGLPQLDGLEIEVLKEVRLVHFMHFAAFDTDFGFLQSSGKRKTQRGDTIDVHYRGTLENGKEFDASYNRGQPLSFTVGKGE